MPKSIPAVSKNAMPKSLNGNASHARVQNDSVLTRRIGITLALLLIISLILLPLINVLFHAFSKGIGYYFTSLQHPDTWSAIRLTLFTAMISVTANMLAGVSIAWCTTKFSFRGKALLLTVLDLPFSISPVVTGLLFVLLFGAHGWFGPFFDRHNLQIIFAIPGIVLVTTFTTFPFVARELIPVMESQGIEQEEAALILGANGWETFWYVTLPNIRWGLLYGVILCNARAMGEFGAVSVVAGSITGVTDTLPLRVEKLYNEYNEAGAFAVASILALLAIVTLIIKTILEKKTHSNAELNLAPMEE